MIELSKLIHIIPHMLQRRMENMSAIHVNINIVFAFTVQITCYMITAIDNKYRFTTLVCLMSKNSTKWACPNY